MNANELRIGNLLQFGGGFVEVDIVILRDLDIYPQSQLKPIPITKNLLFKFGFENQENSNFWRCEQWDELYLLGSDLHFDYEGKTIAIVKYVHQLQNLYFALTGEELTLNSNP